MNKLNKNPKMSKITQTQDFNFSKDIVTMFLEGESHPQDVAVAMLQYLLDKHNILDDEGNAIVVNLDSFPSFGIKGMKSDFIDLNNKVIPIFVVTQTIFMIRSKDWFKGKK